MNTFTRQYNPMERISPVAKIPPEFLRVMTKMYPEISSVEIIEITHQPLAGTCGSGFLTASPYGYDDGEVFIINTRLIINRDAKPQYDSFEYEVQLTEMFKYVYPDMSYVRFNVNDIQIIPKPTRREMVAELFFGN